MKKLKSTLLCIACALLISVPINLSAVDTTDLQYYRGTYYDTLDDNFIYYGYH